MNEYIVQYLLAGGSSRIQIDYRVNTVLAFFVNTGLSRVAAIRLIDLELDRYHQRFSIIAEAQENAATLEAIRIAQEILRGK